MDLQRNILVSAFLLVSFMIWQDWQTEHNLKPDFLVTQKIINTITADKLNHETPVKNKTEGHIITVISDVLSLKINTLGGDIEQALLLSYSDKLGSSEPFHLLETLPEFVYQAQSCLTNKNSSDNISNIEPMLFTANQDTYLMANDQNELRVDLNHVTSDGVVYKKTFTIKRSDFSLCVSYSVSNQSSQPLELTMFLQLNQTIDLPKERDTGSKNFALQTYRGAAYSTKEYKYQKYNFKDIVNGENLIVTSDGGWIAMLQQYFATAWIPLIQDQDMLYTTNLGNGQVAIGFKSKPFNINPGSSYNDIKAVLWLGPEIQDKMAAVAPNLDLVVDYGWLWFISQPLFKLLKYIHSFIGNWGFSIIIITFILRGIMYPLTKAQYISMAKMRMLQPQLEAMRERIGDNARLQSQEMIAIYKSAKVNPLGGCLPLIIQMPIFLALYYMLSSSIELRHAPFILWIQDLSAQDPYYIMPIMMGLTMLFIQKTSPSNITDPVQKNILKLMPIIFTFFFLWFPSGLVLYYIINNLVTIIQQQIIYRSLDKTIIDISDAIVKE